MRKGTAYYVALFTMVGLCFGFGTLILSGGALVPIDDATDMALHESSAVMDDDHNQTALGDMIYGKQAYGHTYPYCGHSTIWRTLSGVVHSIKFIEHLSGGDHRLKAQHWMWSGTGYVKKGDPTYYRVDC